MKSTFSHSFTRVVCVGIFDPAHAKNSCGFERACAGPEHRLRLRALQTAPHRINPAQLSQLHGWSFAGAQSLNLRACQRREVQLICGAECTCTHRRFAALVSPVRRDHVLWLAGPLMPASAHQARSVRCLLFHRVSERCTVAATLRVASAPLPLLCGGRFCGGELLQDKIHVHGPWAYESDFVLSARLPQVSSRCRVCQHCLPSVTGWFEGTRAR